ncbi:MAG TPA: hypothetical protein VNA14_09260 [Mycobacteriales bacterium]|nr:hypothetical protein [Mycobacteriales bacterium]
MRRTAGLLAVVAALCLCPPADAAVTPRLVLRGSGPVSIDLTLRATTTLQVGGFDPVRAMSVKGRARYAGFLLQRADGLVVVGGVVVRGFEVDGVPVPLVFGQGFEEIRVPKGSYRLTLVSDGPAEVSIPAPGLGRSMVLRPTRPASAVGAVLTPSLPGAVPVADLRAPVSVGRRSTTLLATLQRYAVAPAHSYNVCLVPAGGLCATDSVAGGAGVVTATGAGPSSTVSAVYFYPGDVLPGRYDAVFTTAGVGVGERLAAFALRVG